MNQYYLDFLDTIEPEKRIDVCVEIAKSMRDDDIEFPEAIENIFRRYR